MLLDDWLPSFDVSASYAARVAAPPEWVYACLRTADLSRWGLARALVALRTLPALAVAPRESWPRLVERRRRPLTLDALLAGGFVLLGERPGEELVLGTVGQFWRARGGPSVTSAEIFRNPAPPGTAKAAWSFSVRALAGGATELRTETRVACADAATRGRFRAYWAVIGPFSGLIRREMLAAVRDAAERGSRGGGV
jgi:hypothetical protein